MKCQARPLSILFGAGQSSLEVTVEDNVPSKVVKPSGAAGVAGSPLIPFDIRMVAWAPPFASLRGGGRFACHTPHRDARRAPRPTLSDARSHE